LTLAFVAGSPASAQEVPLSRVPIPKPSPLHGSPGAMAPATLPPSVPAGTLLPAPLPEADAPTSEASTAHPADRAYGAFQRGLYLTAVKLAEPLANLGDPAAQTLLGEIYSRGLGVRQDEKVAARWYEAAAKAGSAEGQFRYALLLIDGKVVGQDLAKARDLMKTAADAGIPLAAYNYAQMLIQASPVGGFAEAKPYFETAARAGVADAQYAMSQVYTYGKGVSAPDLAKAREWLQAAALGGHDIAQIELGIWLINGKGGAANAADGARWLLKAAGRGNPIAMNRIAHLYKDGIGVAADKAEAAKWSVLAKRADNTDTSLDTFFRSLDEGAQKAALEAANRFRAS
jgi:TPR repeat protein